MEKIQSAIAKARAERDAMATVAASPVVAPAPISVVPDLAPTSTTLAWAGLKPLNLDAPRLRDNRIVAFAGGHEAVRLTWCAQMVGLNGHHLAMCL